MDILARTTTPTSAIFTNNIILFEVLYDGTNYDVVKENHPYAFNTSVSSYLHNNAGTVIRGLGALATQVTTGTGTVDTDRQVKIVGSDNLDDHGLSSSIPDSGGSGVTWQFYYTNASGKWIRQASQSQVPMYYNNGGTATTLTNGGGTDYNVYTLYVSKNDIESSSPMYVAVMGNGYASAAAAQNAINAGTVNFAGNELLGLEMAQLGYTIVQNNGSGGYISSLTVAKSTFNTQLVGGSAGTEHGTLTGLLDDDHLQYALLAGRNTGQTLIGGTAPTDDLIFRTTSGTAISGADMIFQTGDNGGTEAMRILYDGKIGIGTSNPGVKLQVVGQAGTGNAGVMNITGYDQFRQSLVMQLPSTGYTGALSAIMKAAGGSGQAMGFLTHFTSDVADRFSIANHLGAENFTVLDGGNVGIGTTDPLTKLDVRGGIAGGTNGTEFTVSATGLLTGGTYNSQTISSAASFTGTVNAVTGYKINSGATTGSILRGDGTNFVQSTLILPNAATAYRLPVATSANTIGELAAAGATGEYLAGVTGAIPAWATLNQAAVAGLTTSSSPVFATVKLSALTDGYIPYYVSDASGLANSVVYTDGTNVGIGTTNPTRPFSVDGGAVVNQAVFGQGRAGITLQSTHSGLAFNSYYAGGGVQKSMANGYTGVLYLDNTTGDFHIQTGTNPGASDATTTYTERFTVLNDGNVGIGTTAPRQSLDVLNASNPQMRLTYTDNSVYTDFKTTSRNDLKIIPSSSVDSNFFFGLNAGDNTTVGNNVAIGYQSLQANTTGTDNIAIGRRTLWNGNITGNSNIALGSGALSGNSGSYNGAIGATALAANTGGFNNAFGHQALNANTTGSNNKGIGYKVGYYNQTGNANVLMGDQAGYGVGGSSYSNNTFIGHTAGYSVLGSSNLFLGYQAGYYETGSNKLFIDNAARASEADARTKALMYGIFDAAVANQSLTVNGALNVTGTTTLTGSLLPSANDTYDLGSDSMRWANAWLGAETLHIGTADANEGEIGYTNSTSVMTVQSNGNLALQASSGNVGIGTTNPVSRLHVGVSPTASANYGTLSLGGGYFDGSTTGKFVGSASGTSLAVNEVSGYAGNLLDLQIAGVSKFSFNSVGTLIVGNQIYAGDKIYTNGGYAGASGSDTINFIKRSDASNFMVINGSGNVGIGTTGPAYPLTVNGAIVSQTTNGTAASVSLYQVGQNKWDFISPASSIDLRINENGTPRMTFQSTTGNVGIGTTAPGANRLKIIGVDDLTTNYSLFAGGATTTGLVVRNDGNVGIGTTDPGTYKLNIAGTGYLGASAWVYSSDQRLKENISYLENSPNTDQNSLDKILKLKPARYDYIIGEKNQLGFIAQEVQKVIPEAVVVTNPTTGLLGLKTDFLIPYLVGAIQEQQNQIALLNTKTANLALEGQCVTGDTLLPVRRRRKRKRGSEEEDSEEDYEYILLPICEVEVGDEVLSLNEDTDKTEYHRINGLLDMGVREIYELTTASGRKIRTTANHPYLVKG